VTNFQQSAIFR